MFISNGMNCHPTYRYMPLWIRSCMTPSCVIPAALQSAADYVSSANDGCKLPGVHLEGPYINSKLIGAQNPAYVRLPDIEEVKRLNAIFPVKKVSFAPEVEGGAEFSAELLAMGITPSAVHTNAKYAEFQDAFNLLMRNYACMAGSWALFSSFYGREVFGYLSQFIYF